MPLYNIIREKHIHKIEKILMQEIGRKKYTFIDCVGVGHMLLKPLIVEFGE